MAIEAKGLFEIHDKTPFYDEISDVLGEPSNIDINEDGSLVTTYSWELGKNKTRKLVVEDSGRGGSINVWIADDGEISRFKHDSFQVTHYLVIEDTGRVCFFDDFSEEDDLACLIVESDGFMVGRPKDKEE